VLVCVCVCVCVCVHACALALDCVSWSEGLRFCDLFLVSCRYCLEQCGCHASHVLSAQITYVEFFYRLSVVPFVFEREHMKNKKKFNMCNLSRQNLYLHHNHKNFST
jgi:hypothetical protein